MKKSIEAKTAAEKSLVEKTAAQRQISTPETQSNAVAGVPSQECSSPCNPTADSA